MEPNFCPICNSERRWVPAGTSKKTGKPYNGFWSCPNNCKAPRDNTAPQTREPIPQQPSVKTDNKIWEEKDLRIAREASIKTLASMITPTDPARLEETARTIVEISDKVLVPFIYKKSLEATAQEAFAEEDVDDLPF